MSKILTIIPYAFYPPRNGGSLRCYYVLREIAKEHTVYLFTVQPIADFEANVGPVFPKNVNVISISNAKAYKSVFNLLPNRLANSINYRILKRSFAEKANTFFLQGYLLLKQSLQQISPDIVLFENLEVVGLFSKMVKRQLPSAKQVYDAHNIDSELWNQIAIAQNNQLFKEYAFSALNTEKRLHTLVNEVLCCSDNDKDKLIQLNNKKLKAYVVPNGIDISLNPYVLPAFSKPFHFIFCGSLDYGPNQLGLCWFLQSVWPFLLEKYPQIMLMIVGRGNPGSGLSALVENEQSIEFIGAVDDPIPYYRKAHCAIVPLLHGSGTRLKILEAMSLGIPIMSTTAGADGISYCNGENIMIADTAIEFSAAIVKLYEQPGYFSAISKKARELVEQDYAWDVIGKELRNKLVSFTKNI